MKTLFFALSMSVALIALPAIAQQGPAGVPGAPGLAPPAPPPPVVATLSPEQVKPSQSVPPGKCGKAKSGKPTKSCKPKKAAAPNCSNSPDAARCERYQKTKKLCQDLPDRDYRQCLRDNLTPAK